MDSYDIPYNKSFNEIDESGLKISVDKFENLKSKYILQKIFLNLQKRNTLEIIRYNKKIKHKLNITINDYKKIEIEIIPVKNSSGKFININKGDEKYFHIYFDNDKNEEIKRNYLNGKEKVTKINIIIDYEVKSFYRLFFKCSIIEIITFKNFHRNNITNMDSMFLDCSSLKEIYLFNFNTNNVTNMSAMFDQCSSLKELNLYKFSTKNVTNMSYMFHKCSSLKKLNISNFDNIFIYI